MKKNLGTFFGLPGLGAGVVAMALCAFIPASRADVAIINNLGDTHDGGYISLNDGGTAWAQTFQAGSSGNIDGLTLSLGTSSGSMAVLLYAVNDSGSGPNGTGINLGTVAAATGIVTLNNLTTPLTLGNYYAIALQPAVSGSDSIAWNSTENPVSGGSGTTLYEIYKNSGSGWVYNSSTPYLQMNLEVAPVPEVPMTGMVMGFGALAIVLGRKLRLAVSNIA